MYKVGVVGPKVSVERILSVAKDFSSPLTFTPLIYKETTETQGIVSTNYDEFDYFLFSGPIPYELAKKAVQDTSKFFHIHLLETGFYKALLDLTYSVQKPIERLSIDILNTSNVVDVSLKQLKIPVEKIFVKVFEADIHYRKLYEHHLRLWNEEKIDGILTCYPEVMALFHEKGIPAEWISTTRLATKQVLEVIEQRAEISYFKRTQIGVCMISVDTNVYDDHTGQLSYDLQYATLKMNEEFLLLSREMNGSFINVSDSTYMIFSSRGEMIDNIPILNETIRRLKSLWNRQIKVGIGFGDSALKAELHARKATQMSENKNLNIVLVDNVGEVLNLSQDEIKFVSTISNNVELVERLKDQNVSIQTFERVRNIILRKKWTQFTSKDLALELKVSNRNAQRILLALTKAGLVKQVGEEKVVSQGRPSKLYEMKEEFL